MLMGPPRVAGLYSIHDILADGRRFRDDMEVELTARKGLATERANTGEKRFHPGTSTTEFVDPKAFVTSWRQWGSGVHFPSTTNLYS